VINEHEVKIVGIVKGEQTISGEPSVYAPYNRVRQIAPPVRRSLSYIIVEPQPGVDLHELTKKITKETGLKAFTRDEFFWSTIRWFFVNTAIPISILTAVILGFVVGISVASQTFYSFINENMANFSALKAMGLNNKLLRKMIIVQTLVAGFIGYGIGIGIDALYGIATVNQNQIPFSLIWPIPTITLVLNVIICMTSAYLGIRKVNKVDPEEVFRA